MPQAIEDKVQKVVQEGYSFEARKTFFDGLELVQKNIPAFVGIVIFMLITSYLLGLAGVTGIVINSILVSPLVVGSFFLIADKVKKGERVEPNDIYSSLTYALPLILIGLLSSLILAVVLSPSLISMQNSGMLAFYQQVIDGADPATLEMPQASGTASLVLLLNMIPFLYLAIAFYWGTLFILFHKVSFFRALELSRLVVTKRWWAHFRLSLLFAFVLIVLFLLVSPLALLPTAYGIATQVVSTIGTAVYYAAIYEGFRQVVGVGGEEDADRPDTLMDHLVS